MSGQAPPASPQVSIDYTINLRDAQTQMIDVSLAIRGISADEKALELDLPVWRPGRYQVIDPAGSVRDVHAHSGRGVALPCEKIEKSAWIVSAGPAAGDDQVVVRYRVYGNSLADRTRHADDSHAFIDAATVLMYAPEFRDLPVRVHIDAPDGWKIASGLDADPADASALIAPSYDVLADSPIEVGLHDTIGFEVDHVPHQVIVWTGRRDPAADLGAGYDKAKITDELAKMIRAERDVFGEFPFQRYVFLVHCYPGGGGGTEHLNSTVMQTGPATFADDAGRRRFVGLAAHEYFHGWNVKALRPAGLKPLHGLYDFQHENYTDLLWVCEGTTSYMDQVCLVRAGLTKPDDYLKSLSGMIDGLRSRPGAAAQSVAESSFDAWIKFSKPTPDSVNSTVSFYDKGAAVSYLLDMELRKRTNNDASLDAVLRELYRLFPLSGPGYTSDDLAHSCERLSASSFRQFFTDYVDGVRPLDFEAAAEAAGLELTHQSAPDPEKKDKASAGSEAAPASTTEERAYIGLNLESRDGLAAVSSVLVDGPAYHAGVIAGDLIVALNGTRVRAGELNALLAHYKPGQVIKLTLFRYDQLREIEFPAAGRFEGKWTLRRVKHPSDQQKAVYESWLGQKWPAENSDQRPAPTPPDPQQPAPQKPGDKP